MTVLMEHLRNKADWEKWIKQFPELSHVCPPERFPCFAVETVRMEPDGLESISVFEALYLGRTEVEQMLSALRNGK